MPRRQIHGSTTFNANTHPRAPSFLFSIRSLDLFLSFLFSFFFFFFLFYKTSPDESRIDRSAGSSTPCVCIGATLALSRETVYLGAHNGRELVNGNGSLLVFTSESFSLRFSSFPSFDDRSCTSRERGRSLEGVERELVEDVCPRTRSRVQSNVWY